MASAGRKQKLQNYIQKLRNRNKQLFSNNDYAAPPVTRPPVVRTTIRTTTTMAPVRRQYMDYGDRIVLYHIRCKRNPENNHIDLSVRIRLCSSLNITINPK